MTEIFDPITGEKLDIYGARVTDDEVYRCNNDKVIATICNNLRIARIEAIRLLQNSDIDNPITVCDEIFWSE